MSGNVIKTEYDPAVGVAATIDVHKTLAASKFGLQRPICALTRTTSHPIMRVNEDHGGNEHTGEYSYELETEWLEGPEPPPEAEIVT